MARTQSYRIESPAAFTSNKVTRRINNFFKKYTIEVTDENGNKIRIPKSDAKLNQKLFALELGILPHELKKFCRNKKYGEKVRDAIALIQEINRGMRPRCSECRLPEVAKYRIDNFFQKYTEEEIGEDGVVRLVPKGDVRISRALLAKELGISFSTMKVLCETADSGEMISEAIERVDDIVKNNVIRRKNADKYSRENIRKGIEAFFEKYTEKVYDKHGEVVGLKPISDIRVTKKLLADELDIDISSLYALRNDKRNGPELPKAFEQIDRLYPVTYSINHIKWPNNLLSAAYGMAYENTEFSQDAVNRLEWLIRNLYSGYQAGGLLGCFRDGYYAHKITKEDGNDMRFASTSMDSALELLQDGFMGEELVVGFLNGASLKRDDGAVSVLDLLLYEGKSVKDSTNTRNIFKSLGDAATLRDIKAELLLDTPNFRWDTIIRTENQQDFIVRRLKEVFNSSPIEMTPVEQAKDKLRKKLQKALGSEYVVGHLSDETFERFIAFSKKLSTDDRAMKTIELALRSGNDSYTASVFGVSRQAVNLTMNNIYGKIRDSEQLREYIFKRILNDEPITIESPALCVAFEQPDDVYSEECGFGVRLFHMFEHRHITRIRDIYPYWVCERQDVKSIRRKSQRAVEWLWEKGFLAASSIEKLPDESDSPQNDLTLDELLLSNRFFVAGEKKTVLRRAYDVLAENDVVTLDDLLLAGREGILAMQGMNYSLYRSIRHRVQAAGYNLRCHNVA